MPSPVLSTSMRPVYGPVKTYVNEAYQATDFSSVRVVGCDELSARKGHNNLSVFADLDVKRVLYVTEGKDASTWDRFAVELPQHGTQAKQIKCVSIDMSPAYRKGAKKNAQMPWWSSTIFM